MFLSDKYRIANLKDNGIRVRLRAIQSCHFGILSVATISVMSAIFYRATLRLRKCHPALNRTAITVYVNLVEDPAGYRKSCVHLGVTYCAAW